jgi:opacity protein-like surface antigen
MAIHDKPHYFRADVELSAQKHFPARINQIDGNSIAPDDTLAQPGNRYDSTTVYCQAGEMMNHGPLQGETLLLRRNQRGSGLPSPACLCCRIIAAALLAVSIAVCALPAAHAQTRETASRVGDLQLGGGFVFANSNFNFNPIHLIGGAFYTTFDMRNHWGGEFDFRNNTSSSDSTVYERTYEIGPRIFVRRGDLVPYAKVLYGRGVYNFSNNAANVAYNMYTLGGGADYQVRPSINIRVDYEYQTWMGFPIADLHPSVFTVGVAYHFHE